MVHLHTHSMYSLRDSIIRPEDFVQRLKEIGQDTIAITDHGGSLGGVTLYQTLKANGIRYIHGCEFYICDDTSVRDKNNKYYHLIALCKNETGRINLNTLISMSEHPSRKYFKPRIDFNLLAEHKDGLIIMSACLAGEVSKAILNDEYDLAVSIAKKYHTLLGDDYYLEVQSHMDPKQIAVNQKILEISEQLHISCVVTTDAHYTREVDRKYQNKYAFNGSYKEDGEAYVDCYLQSEQEVRDKLSYLPPAVIDLLIQNTESVAEKCQVEIPLSAPIMPKVQTPQEYRSNTEWLEVLCQRGFASKLNIDLETHTIVNPDKKLHRSILNEEGEEVGVEEYQLTDEQIQKYIDRYHYELDALVKMGFVDYILLVYSYANVGKRRGIARGSGGGSLINYLTNITNIDPIEHGLYFERFIDVGALDRLASGEITAKELKIPDIDLDFSGESCKDVLMFLYNTYGADKVASIGKFGTNKTKGSIRDLCKVLEIDLSTADMIAKSFENFEIDEIDQMITGAIPVSGSAKQAIKFTREYPELFEYVRKLNGLPKSFGLHACGKIISTRELDYFLPSCYDDNGVRFLQGDMHAVEDVGLVKIDLLGLRTLDQEYDTLEMTEQDMSFLDPRQRYTDPKVLDIFRNGDTLGIFQMASPGMKQTLKKMNVSGIEDLSVANALFRPGSMQYIDNYCRRKKGEEVFEYLHPDLEPILRNTYGIIVFQEQLIEIGRMAGLHNPDLLRKATGKKNHKLLAEIKPELEGKLKSRGWSQAQFDQLWADMLDFAKYSFNKAHSSAYAIIAYMTAKQKAYYPAEFFAGLCNSYLGASDFVKENAAEIMADASRHKVRLEPFSFRDDHRRCSVKDGKILYAIPLIRDCNAICADVIYQFKDSTESYFWLLAKQMIESGLEKSKMRILIQLNFFSEYGNAKQLLRIFDFLELFKFGARRTIRKDKLDSSDFLYEVIKKYAKDHNAKGEELKQFTILDVDSILSAIEDHMKQCDVQDFSAKMQAAYQNEYLGFVFLATGKEIDRPKLFVKEVYPVCRKSDNKQFGYSVITQSLGSGKESRFTVFNRVFDKEPIQKNDLILCKHYTRDGPYFQMDSYTHII